MEIIKETFNITNLTTIIAATPTTIITTTVTTATATATVNHDLIIAKCMALVCMLLCTLFAGSIPHFLNHYLKWTQKTETIRSSKTLQCLMHFGGGVLLSTIFIHIIPEVREIVQHLQNCQIIQKFTVHITEILVCWGFFLMYLIDEALHSFFFLRHRHTQKNDQKSNHDNTVGHNSIETCTSYINPCTNTDMEKSFNNNINNNNNNNNHNNSNSNSNNNSNSNSNISTITMEHHQQHQHHQQQQQQQQHQHNDCELPVASEFTTAATTISCLDQCHSIAGHSHLPIATASTCDNGKTVMHTHPYPHTHSTYVTSSFRGLLIVLGLSLHEIFEGLAIGLEDEPDAVWFLFAAVSAHKLILAFCVGVELIVARTKILLIILYSIIFAVTSPIGIAIGIFITHDDTFGVDSPVSVILQGLAAGTLLYVVFFEILSKHRSGLLAFTATLIGFCVMIGVQQLGHSHEHNHNGLDDCLHSEHRTVHHEHF